MISTVLFIYVYCDPAETTTIGYNLGWTWVLVEWYHFLHGSLSEKLRKFIFLGLKRGYVVKIEYTPIPNDPFPFSYTFSILRS